MRPLVVVNRDDYGVLINPPGATRACGYQDRRGGGCAGPHRDPLWIVGDPVTRAPDATVSRCLETPEPLSTILSVLPMQILANQIADVLSADPDRFRRDDPVYADALGTLTL